MRKFINKWIYGLVLLGFSFAGCTDLDVDVVSEFTDSTFPRTEEDFASLTAGVYGEAKHNINNMWFSQELGSDACILPVMGGTSWYDGRRYKDFHMHSWGPEHGFISSLWSTLFAGVSKCNVVIDILERSAEEGPLKDRSIAEIRGMRAYFYFRLMDNFGGVPVIAKFGDAEGKQNTRKEVFEFIESELLDIMDNLSDKSDESTYSKVNKWTAYALLAKLNINAQVYIGENRGANVVNYCDMVIAEANANATYELTDDYLSVFHYENGPHIKDIIFAIPFDGWEDTSNSYGLFFTRYWLLKPFQAAWGIKKGSGPMRVLPSFYELFEKDANDVRTNQFLTGKQYDLDGNPIIVSTTYEKLDEANFKGNSDAVEWHLELTKDVTIPDLETWDAGVDWVSDCEGYRSVKFYPDVNGSVPDRRQSNDFPILRYADILMMKAEAILVQQATATNGETALSLVNQVRSRAKANVFTVDQLTIDELCDERGREFSYEFWRRNDLIRFGKYEDAYGFKTNNDPTRRLFPIPDNAKQLNPALEQNPGY